MLLSAKLRNRRLATPCTNYGTVGENMESGVLFVGSLQSTISGKSLFVAYTYFVSAPRDTASLTYYIPTMERLLEFSWHHSSTDIPIGRFLQDSTI